LLVLLQFNLATILLGCLSLVTIAIYPFMKRVTWWPQLFLGFAFSWGALVGWSSLAGEVALPALVLYAGSICWVIGYDTIYALQDIEDDGLVGVKSTARLFGDSARKAIAALFAAAGILFAAALYSTGVGWPAWVGLALGGAHMAWQITVLAPGDAAQNLRLFKSNHHFGMIVFAGLILSLAI
jgi:4-hydroxybenzoate polyprenyltransferase